MNAARRVRLAVLLLSLAAALPARADLIVNGGFEAGLSGWTTADQLASDGTFVVQSGVASPVNGDPVPPPPEGVNAAMTDQQAGGSHVLYQDFLVAAPVSSLILRFELFVGNRAGDFFAPDTLDWATPTLNQQARVDLMLATADPFSVESSDIVQQLVRTLPGDPAVTPGYVAYAIDVTAALNAHIGSTLRLRFAEVDNVGPFQLGVDDVRFGDNGGGSTVPEPSSLLLALAAAAFASRAKRRSRASWSSAPDAR